MTEKQKDAATHLVNHPKYPLLATAALKSILLVSLITTIWFIFSNQDQFSHSITELEQLSENSKLLETSVKTLSAAAKLGSFVGDISWENQYEKSEKSFQDAIAILQNFKVDSESNAYSSELSDLIDKQKEIAQIDYRAFDLTRSHGGEAARDILFSLHYESLQEAIQTALNRLNNRRGKIRNERTQMIQCQFKKEMYLLFTALFVEIISSFLIFLLNARWVKELNHLNLTLEEKVIERTQQLTATQIEITRATRLSALAEMASGIAHEINNPLSVIEGFNAQAIKVYKKDPTQKEKIEKLLDGIGRSSTRISKIIRGLRTFSRDGSQDPFEQANFRAIVDETLELCHSRIRSRGIDLQVSEIPPDLSLSCRSVEISQVIMNLVNNAADAIEVLPERWIRIEVYSQDKILSFSVTDSGSGIAEHLREKILQPFFTTKPVGKGTGLGLSIASSIAERHGGKLTIDSTCKNTRFILNLPFTPTSVQSEAA